MELRSSLLRRGFQAGVRRHVDHIVLAPLIAVHGNFDYPNQADSDSLPLRWTHPDGLGYLSRGWKSFVRVVVR